ncbi:MAG: hypothetical protein GOP50_02465 [Candidatus Heimdallarchaeota archaeon]|nr:hypothetical protein [Candidatus Heimdallarchaeota archaeon]
MYSIEKFKNLPKHQDLIDRATEVVIADSRVVGLYIGGSQTADEYSDIDLSIYFNTEEDLNSFRNDRLEAAKKIGKFKAESMSGFPFVYVVFYEEEEVKVDFAYNLVPAEPRPDKIYFDILYDPEGHLERMMEESRKMKWEVDIADLTHRAKHYQMGISYTVGKICRGEFWDALDCIDYYRKYLVKFEDSFAQRKQENYRRLEKKLDKERLAILNKTLLSELTQKSLFDGMDAIFEYFDRYLKDKFQALGIFPEEYAKNMREYYEKMKKETLDSK